MTISKNDFLNRAELRSLEDEVIQNSLASLELGQFDLSLLAIDQLVQFNKETPTCSPQDLRMESAMEIQNFVQTLKGHALTQPTKTAIKYYNDGETLSAQLNYLEVDQFSRQVAAHLQTVCKPGDRVLLLCPQGIPFYFSFLGCLYARAIAVPAYPPKKNRNFERLRAILSDSDASVILCTREVKENLDADTLKNLGDQHVTILCIEDIQAKPLAYRETNPELDEVAFLQYTSGSTGSPKGVMVTHRNIATNIKMIMEAWEVTPETIHSSWLPVYHDMGLIGLFLSPLYAGAQLGAMPPTAFLQKPSRWLTQMSNDRANLSVAPNFAFYLSLKSFAQNPTQIDLSCIKTFGNGAEPVQADAIRAFADYFSKFGFKANAIFPCYGLAEATLFVSGHIPTKSPTILSLNKTSLEEGVFKLEAQSQARELVSCGKISKYQKLSIVNPQTKTVCKTGEIGEIWLAGDNIAKGYWKKEELNVEAFSAKIASSNDTTSWLRTGDLGYVHEGELYVTGRLKDMIKLNGRAIYPQDIELTIQKASRAIKAGSVTCFAVKTNISEGIGVAFEVERTQMKEDFSGDIAAIQQAVFQEFDASLFLIAALKPGTLPKTSSGKLQRQLTKKLITEGKLETLYCSRPDMIQGAGMQNKTETTNTTKYINWLIPIIAKTMQISPETIVADKPLAIFGLDSLTIHTLVAEIKDNYGVEIAASDFDKDLTLNQIAGFISQKVEMKKAG